MSSALHTPDDDLGLDLDAARSAREEEADQPPHIKIGGHQLNLPFELPVDVLAPLTEIDVDLPYVIREVLDARKADPDKANEAMLDVIVNMLIAKPSLPLDLLGAVKTMARRLFGDEGYTHLVDAKPSLKECGAILRYLGRKYGVGLGEASPSSDSSEGTGTTSKQTSRRTTASTSGRSGGGRQRQGS